MKRVIWNELGAAARRSALARPRQRSDEMLQTAVRAIVDQVQRDGWRGLVDLALRIDGEAPRAVEVGPLAASARRRLPTDQVEAMQFAASRIRAFHEASLPADFVMETRRSHKNSAAFLSDLVGLSSFHQFYGWLIGEQIAVREVQMAYDEGFEKDVFMDFFQVPVRLGGDRHRFRIGRDILERPVVRSYPELERLLETFPLDVMPPDYRTSRISDHVRKIMYSALLNRAALPTIPDLAGAFGLSSATFRRRLAEEETSIGKVKESCRRQLAEELLGRGEPIQVVATRLGFSDTTCFRRAFKHWTGTAPSRWRG